jgi:protein SCO1
MHLIKTKKYYLLLLALFILGCKEKLPIIEDISNKTFVLIDQNNDSKEYPACSKGNITVVSYIFTNCPDICPLTTNNMRLIQEKVNKEKIRGIKFVSISFDPLQDSPTTLRKFAEVRDLDLSNWTFFTGTKPTIDSLMKQIGIIAVIGDSTVFKSGKKIYYYVHTDRIQLMDKDGKIRKNYKGSSINTSEIVKDIKLLN